ncbi:helix-turn-helix domain-containing protein [Pseudoalteromonas sp. P1-25]|uniref:helix-turn-helix domain-containing protein n=1 Tax=Pseudoalteromonas sp. P1-25 TaxID=1723758 RepID=UPI0006D662F3|nr:helix-turn-helix transcriptional regulator [Pseudoalteromonas sp. P1-25]KPZ53933.1 Helix-turn-helix domain protein [Pseudoalteromonas sp. P1-25]USN27149.1 Helix-turn-helix domain protein [synthetic construct]|tara:strand:- start:4282 stop:4590 length:309 start_codon:yes stop_codon:yes gene_type:complete
METPTPSRLKSARKAAGLTQQQLGMALGMEPNTASARMNQYEKGKHAPDFLTMKRIAKELDVPVAYFYCEEDVLADLIISISKLNEKKLAKLIEYIESTKEK